MQNIPQQFTNKVRSMHSPRSSTTEMPRSSTTEMPRRKIFLSHLGKLLDHHIIQPETVVAKKLFPHSNAEAPRHRSKSSLVLRLRKSDHEPIQAKRDPFSYRSLQLPQTHAKPRPKKPLFDQFRPKSTVLNEGNASVQGTIFTFQTKSAQFSHFNSIDLNPSEQKQQRRFLRKGSNLQKQIVTSLIRSSAKSKMIGSRHYSKGQILKMIQIYKGVQQLKPSSKKVLISYTAREKNKRVQPRDIKGWEHEPIELEIDDTKE